MKALHCKLNVAISMHQSLLSTQIISEVPCSEQALYLGHKQLFYGNLRINCSNQSSVSHVLNDTIDININGTKFWYVNNSMHCIHCGHRSIKYELTIFDQIHYWSY